MLNFFPRPETPKRQEEEDDSPIKDNTNKVGDDQVAPEEYGHHDDSS